MSKQRLVTTVFLVVLIVSMVGCTPKATPITNTATAEIVPTQPEKITLEVWDQGDPSSSADVYKKYMELHPNVTIQQTVYASQVDELAAFTAALPAGKGPDVAYYDATPQYLGEMVKAGYAADLTPYAKKYGWDTKFAKYAQNLTTYNGKLYGVGGFTEIVGIFYNADLFQKYSLQPPTTWENMIAAAEKAKVEGLMPFAQGDLDLWPASHFCGAIVLAMVPFDIIYGAENLAADGSWADPKMVAAAAECQDWVLKYGYYPKDINAIGYEDSIADFVSGKALMRVDGSWSIGSHSVADFTVRFVRFPEKDPSAFPPQAEGGISSTWFINANSKHVDAAAEFLDFVVFSDFANESYSKVDGLIPSVTSFNPNAEGVPALIGETFKAIEAAGFAMAAPSFQDWMSANFQALFAGKMTPEEFAQGAADAMNTAREAAK
jgi:raffinose/stachyose/melibiose transport system substrate-binding protein